MKRRRRRDFSISDGRDISSRVFTSLIPVCVRYGRLLVSSLVSPLDDHICIVSLIGLAFQFMKIPCIG